MARPTADITAKVRALFTAIIPLQENYLSNHYARRRNKQARLTHEGRCYRFASKDAETASRVRTIRTVKAGTDDDGQQLYKRERAPGQTKASFLRSVQPLLQALETDGFSVDCDSLEIPRLVNGRKSLDKQRFLLRVSNGEWNMALGWGTQAEAEHGHEWREQESPS